MLTQLYIKNFTLIDELSISFESGFSVITGETGAGKSIILGALSLIMGQRADVGAIKKGREKCLIEAHFDISQYNMAHFFEEADLDYDASDCIIRREVSSSGKSRAFVNDCPVSLSVLKELGEHLIDIHSQHQNLLLNKENFQLSVVDIMAKNPTLLADYRLLYDQYHAALKELDTLRTSIEQSKEREDFLRFQCNELKEARLKEGEQEELELTYEQMSHAEEVKEALCFACNAFDGDDAGILTSLKQVGDRVQTIASLYPDMAELQERLSSCYIELKDISDELSSRVDDVEFSPQRLSEINDRLHLLYSLEKKYKVENEMELIELYGNLSQQLQTIDNSDEALLECQAKVDRLHGECVAKAALLTTAREKAAKLLEGSLKDLLVGLGIPNVCFFIRLTAKELTHDGADKVSFLFSANKNVEPQPVSQVASGGEIARVMLSIKAMISEAVQLPTIIFDEIDTGVSGRVAEKMAHIMQIMGQQKRQVIAISHLPQIASKGSIHYQVSKEDNEEGTVSKMVRLSDEERVLELAKMLSGSDITPAAIDNAKALLGVN
ncbi:MAG: DNA repair protein RecN [Prevotella sp.]|nr:DNA repair protein RecN [Prevotella sp.]